MSRIAQRPPMAAAAASRWPVVLALLSLTCSVFDDERIPLDKDIREYARQARARLGDLTPEQRSVVAPALLAHEQAIARYDWLMTRGQERRRMQAPLIATGAFVLADDVSLLGITNDEALPFLALGAVAIALGTDAPASSRAIKAAYSEVLDTARGVTRALESSRVRDATKSPARPGTKDYCIERYTDCQLNGHRRFSCSMCQPCMDWCMGAGYFWPQKRECNYRRAP